MRDNVWERIQYPEQWPSLKNLSISRPPVSLTDSHLEGPHPLTLGLQAASLISLSLGKGKKKRGKSGIIATKIVVFVNHLQTRLHPFRPSTSSESKVPSHEDRGSRLSSRSPGNRVSGSKFALFFFLNPIILHRFYPKKYHVSANQPTPTPMQNK